MRNAYPSRIREFHENMANNIPCTPNKNYARQELAEMPLPELLMEYISWMSCFIAPRKRSVTYTDEFWDCSAGLHYHSAIREIERKTIAGDDMTPYLPKHVNQGYVASRSKKSTLQWGNKDAALNSYRVHYLHLGERNESDGHTDALLYIAFSRNDAVFLMIGDSRSVDDGTLAHVINRHRVQNISNELMYEKEHYSQLRRLEHYGILMHSDMGDPVFPALKAVATPGLATTHVQRIIYTITQLDKDIENIGAALFSDACIFMPPEPDYMWSMNDCDLSLVESTLGVGFPLVLWWQ
ncbi:MAG: hypothetical protein K2Q33_06860 [Gammaproteobacteria bacterium]|nr:hypothetical protein [Gammaproteobacteria bacterium]